MLIVAQSWQFSYLAVGNCGVIFETTLRKKGHMDDMNPGPISMLARTITSMNPGFPCVAQAVS